MLIFLLLAIEVALLVLSYLILKRDIFQPFTVMMAVFVVSTTIACFNFKSWHIYFAPKTIVIMSLGFLCALAANILVVRIPDIVREPICRPVPKIEVSYVAIAVVVCLELLTLYFYYQDIVRIAAIDGYTPGSNLLWHYRNATSYHVIASLNPLIAILTKIVAAIGYVFTFIIICNVLDRHTPVSKICTLCVPVALFAIQVLLGSGRQELLRLGSFAIVVIYILINSRNGWRNQYSKKFIAGILACIPIAFLGFYLATNLIGRKTSRSFFVYISTYAGGSIQHFNEYIMDPSQAKPTSHFGEETFPGVYSLLYKLHLTDFHRPVHLELRPLGITKGNIYTFFRRPYHDFGLFGMCLMAFLVLLVFSWLYASIKVKGVNNHTNVAIIRYAYLFYWIILASIDQYSIGIFSAGTVLTLILFSCVYYMVVQFPAKPDLEWRYFFEEFTSFTHRVQTQLKSPGESTQET
ncbi:hypothetical protein CRD60_06800 [Bifidobacterium aemilianum]|uniref:Oligosaccharide repeat unit polymerase n=1 Tax=Bifidobacterium aemilianum TaxID=2493120 RepID=A0A366K825_9BIFI|nr:O-antigen polymerase [Bifidobacterium aemilianum]RBP97467.1 hypothetical protein CRD60_06800 [Bifidobacterium aemilianum]